jgi:hypothetical protein
MSRSPADAISKAVERSQQLLFPFNANKWFALGFTVFLAQCSDGGGGSFPSLPSGPSSTPSSGGGGGSGFDFQRMLDDALASLNHDLALYVTLAAVGALLVAGLAVLVIWFSSRAKLMFVESVIWDRVDVGAQWARAAELGMSLSKFRLALGFGGWLLFLCSLGAAAVVALPDFRSGDFFGTRALIGYLILGGSALFIGLPLAVVSALLDDFVVPLMVIRNARVRQAWAICRAEVLAGNIGGIMLFYLLRVGLAFAIAIAAMVISCVTCCLTAIPYVGTVIMLPIFVFSRAYPLYYLEGLGVSVFPAPEPAWAQYDAWRFPR